MKITSLIKTGDARRALLVYFYFDIRCDSVASKLKTLSCCGGIKRQKSESFHILFPLILSANVEQMLKIQMFTVLFNFHAHKL